MLTAGLALCGPAAHAQHWSFRMFGPAQGLTNPTVIALKQDQRGFLWVSTEAGLSRYDGDRFEAFPLRAGARNALANTLHPSAGGKFWVGASAGVFVLDGSRFKQVPGFENVEITSGQALASDAVNLFVATLAGLKRMPLNASSRPAVISPKPSYSVLKARDGALWFGCGLLLCSLENGRETEWGAGSGVEKGPWSSIAEDGAGRLWIRSKERVLIREPGAGRFRALRLGALDSTRCPLLIPIPSGQMLIPHYGGLMVCDGEDCRNHGTESGLRRAEALTALEDREGSLWIGYGGHGLARWLGRDQWQSYAEQDGLTDLGIWRVVRDAAGRLWVGTSRGLFRGVQRDGRLRFERSDAVGEMSVYGLLADPDGSLWIGVFQSRLNGLLRYYPSTGKKILYPPARPVPRFSISEISRGGDGAIYVATPRGVLWLPPGRRELEPAVPQLDGDRVYNVNATPEGLFAAGRKGLFIQQGDSGRLLTTADGLKDDAVQSAVRGPDGAVWIAYFSPSGMTRLTFEGSRVHMRHYSAADGLPSDVIYSNFFDARGRHWVATDNGVAILEGQHWVRYDETDGFVWNDCNAHAYLAEPDGAVWIGTSGGLARYFPAPPRKRELPETVITSLLRNDEPASGTDFDAATHSVGLRFTMLSYERQAASFRYRIGSGGPWVNTASHEVRLAQPAPGSYAFEVQGQLGPDQWARPAVLQFRIRPAWYLAWPSRAAAIALLAGAVWLWWRRREERHRRIRADLEAAVEERTRDLAAAVERAEQASRIKGEFVANMSHEMRTPLNGVIGLTQLALEVADQPEVARHLRVVQFSAKGLLSLINDVLDFSKIESGRMEVIPAAFEIRAFAGEVCAMLEHEAARKRLALTHSVDEAVSAWVRADDARLRQVLVNLLGNALKFTSAGSVNLHVGMAGNQVEFSVTDTGAGIPADKSDLIFAAFRQADSSTSRRHGGTGLGLTISKKLVEAMGGRLQVRSEVGKGSAFWFAIDAPPAAPVVESAAGSAGDGLTRALKILVAEDNPVNQYLIVALLKKRGHAVTVASNGLEALAALERGAFNLILMDIQMPEMDGLETIRRIREAETKTGAHVPAVALTARNMAGDRELFLSAGMDDYLEKPIQTERLDAILMRFAGPFGLNSSGAQQAT
jgi:signal transduction histidine kinase/CheY-like chemotaxis protein/ligand-binding sensor domain-containing protein